MGKLLHQEFDVVVIAVRPWGLEVELQGGTHGLIDNTKDPSWPSGERALVGSRLCAAVVDDQRAPMRLSALDVDLGVARDMRSRRDCC
ncbi:hypothetical protein AB0K09_13835 [Streptomyces sp. NPDC049577]|uniref:hypothetical protein n=1 Tax=Streptomyces sp. NPDC049577 TaxID=3155153 RepID=UPI0034446523